MVSPSTARRDRIVKRALYLERGVAHCWIVDAEARAVRERSVAGHLLQLGRFPESLRVEALRDAKANGSLPPRHEPEALQSVGSTAMSPSVRGRNRVVRQQC